MILTQDIFFRLFPSKCYIFSKFIIFLFDLNCRTSRICLSLFNESKLLYSLLLLIVCQISHLQISIHSKWSQASQIRDHLYQNMHCGAQLFYSIQNKTQQFYCKVMERYYQQPQFKGRMLTQIIESRGKKHYWGLKGKNYGFYTTNDEIQMEERYRQHRRLKSQYSNYRSIPHQRESSESKVNPAYRLSTLPVEASEKMPENTLAYSAVPTQQINPEGNIGIFSPQLKGEQAQQKLKNLSISRKNVQINLTPLNIKLPQIRRKSQVHEGVRVNEGANLNENRFELSKEGNVVYYTRKDRTMNPTYCNSPGYPLPCYRYIG